MPLRPGTQVGPYEIVAAIGAGGMGEVYRAHDPKLNRAVAIKVLPEAFAADKDRVARFEREAQSLAALNHTNIAQVFGVLDLPREGAPHGVALVMEFVDGEDLAQRLARGPMAPDDVLPIARQVAEALEAAHERGIIHRDLKPANVKLRSDGTVKVLDFGLAKALAPPDANPQALLDSPTVTSPVMTQMGVMLGTAAYMAPEQAKGKPVDRRADVWAFGVVLYEMLTGVSPFAGESIGDVIAAVLTKDVDWRLLPARTPPSIRRLLERCLQRDARRRLRDFGDAVLEIDAAADLPAPVTTGQGGRTPVRAWIAVLAAAVALTAVATSKILSRQTHPRQIRAAMIPDAGFLDFSAVAVSPDGTEIAYYRDGAVGGGDLLVRRLEGFTDRVIAPQVSAIHPFFSPQGDQVGYSSVEQRAVFRVALSGGAPIEVVRVTEMMPALWLEDGSIIVATAQIDGRIERGLSRVPAAGGPAVPLTTLGPNEDVHIGPAALPGGKRILFTVVAAGGHRLAVADLDKPGAHRILPFTTGASTPKFLSSGHLLYFEPSVQQVRAVPFDPATAEATGESVVVLTNVHRGIDATGSYEVSRDGHLFYTPEDAGDIGRRFRLAWSGEGSPAITETRASWAQPRLSPDGRRLVVRETATPNCAFWLYDLDRGSRTKIVATDPHDPVWYPDSRRLVFSSVDGSGFRRMFTTRVDRTDPPVPFDTGYVGNELPRSMSSDGAWLAVSRSTPKTGADVWIVPTAGGDARLLAGSDFAEDYAAFSPDGRSVAYTSNQSGRDEVYVRPWPGAAEQYQASTAGGTGAIWSSDTRLLYADARRVVSVDLTFDGTGPQRVRAGRPQPFFDGTVVLQRVGNYDLARDGRRLVFVEGTSSDSRVGRDLRVIFNWIDELKRRVPIR